MAARSFDSNKTAARQAEQTHAEDELHRTQKLLAQANQDLVDLSTPVIEIWNGVLAIPLVGTLDSARAQETMEQALTRMAERKSQVLIIDITGVPVIDTMVANHLLKMSSAVGLMGGECILTGIGPSTAMTIVSLGIDLSQVVTRSTLADGLKHAMRLVGAGRER